MVKKVVEIGMLYDFYGQLLTDKQRDVIDLYYNNDLSLGEISQAVGASRQGVYDLLKRSEKLLYYYEEKLGLVKKFNDQKNKIGKAYKLLDSMESSELIEKVKGILKDMVDTDI